MFNQNSKLTFKEIANLLLQSVIILFLYVYTQKKNFKSKYFSLNHKLSRFILWTCKQKLVFVMLNESQPRNSGISNAWKCRLFILKNRNKNTLYASTTFTFWNIFSTLISKIISTMKIHKRKKITFKLYFIWISQSPLGKYLRTTLSIEAIKVHFFATWLMKL